MQDMPPNGGAAPQARSAVLQDTYLSECQRQTTPVTVYLVNGFQLKGTIKGFDAFTIVLDYENRQHLIYKHAVSTVSPQGPFVFELGLNGDVTKGVA